jgi:hypothetical protein
MNKKEVDKKEVDKKEGTDESIIYNKNSIVTKRLKQCHYLISMKIKNPCIDIYSLVDFDTICFICNLNPNVFEKSEVVKTSDNQSDISLLFCHFFKSFGIQQKFIKMKGTKTENDEGTKKQFDAVNNVDTSEKLNPNQLLLEKFQMKVTRLENSFVQVDCELGFQFNVKTLPSCVEILAAKICMRFVSYTKRYFERIKELKY